MFCKHRKSRGTSTCSAPATSGYVVWDNGIRKWRKAIRCVLGHYIVYDFFKIKSRTKVIDYSKINRLGK